MNRINLADAMVAICGGQCDRPDVGVCEVRLQFLTDIPPNQQGQEGADRGVIELGLLIGVWCVQRRVAAWCGHVFPVAHSTTAALTPAAGQVRHRRGEDATVANHLPGRGGAGCDELGVHLTVGLHLGVRALTGDLRDIVRLGVVRGAVVRVQLYALAVQGLGQ
jgi:hypothetical protein